MPVRLLLPTQEPNSPCLPTSFLEKVDTTSIPEQRCDSSSEFFSPFGFRLEGANARIVYSMDSPPEGSLGVQAFHSAVVSHPQLPFPKADGLAAITKRVGTKAEKRYFIRTADCLATAFSCEMKGYQLSAIVHAGWRGLTGGIHFEALHLLKIEAERHGFEWGEVTKKLHAHLSPGIFGVSYECGQDVLEALEEHESLRLKSLPFWADVKDAHLGARDVSGSASTQASCRRKLHLNSIFPDLQLLMVCELLAFGLPAEKIEIMRLNTYGHHFLPSYRYSTHNGLDSTCRLSTQLVVQE